MAMATKTPYIPQRRTLTVGCNEHGAFPGLVCEIAAREHFACWRG